MSARGKRIRSGGILLGVLLALGGVSGGLYRLRQAQASVTFPVAPARQGDFLVIVRCRGDLKANRSVPVYAPMVPNLRIAWLAAIIMTFAGQRDLLGHSLFMLVMSYKVHTLSALTALAMVLMLRAHKAAGTQLAEEPRSAVWRKAG